MRQQLVNPAVHVHRQPRQHIFQVSMRVVPVELGRLDQAHHRRRPLAAAQRARKQPIVPSYRYRPYLVFDTGYPFSSTGSLKGFFYAFQRFLGMSPVLSQQPVGVIDKTATPLIVTIFD